MNPELLYKMLEKAEMPVARVLNSVKERFRNPESNWRDATSSLEACIHEISCLETNKLVIKIIDLARSRDKQYSCMHDSIIADLNRIASSYISCFDTLCEIAKWAETNLKDPAQMKKPYRKRLMKDYEDFRYTIGFPFIAISYSFEVLMSMLNPLEVRQNQSALRRMNEAICCVAKIVKKVRENNTLLKLTQTKDVDDLRQELSCYQKNIST